MFYEGIRDVKIFFFFSIADLFIYFFTKKSSIENQIQFLERDHAWHFWWMVMFIVLFWLLQTCSQLMMKFLKALCIYAFLFFFGKKKERRKKSILSLHIHVVHWFVWRLWQIWGMLMTWNDKGIQLYLLMFNGEQPLPNLDMAVTLWEAMLNDYDPIPLVFR